MIALIYQITLREPVLVTMLDGEPNSKVSLEYLPGSVLRGAVIRAYTGGNRIELDLEDEVAKRLFFDNATCFLNGYPVPGSGPKKRSLPTPLSWHTEKGQESPVHDFAHVKYARTTPDNEKQWKGAGKPFRTQTELGAGQTVTPIRLLKPDRQLAVHTTRARARGRSTSEDGEIFRYDAMAPHQVFQAAVLCRDKADADRVRGLLAQTSTLGGSRNAGYGQVCVTALPADENKPWREFDLPVPAASATRLTVTLLSDALLRDENGQHAVSLVVMEQALQKYIPDAKIILEQQAQDSALEPRQAFVREEIVGGFNRKWGLPLPQSQAFKMGSVFIVNVLSVDPAKIAALEETGIGERRNEGFGRVGVTSSLHEQWTLLVDDKDKGAKRKPDVLDDFGVQAATLSQGRSTAQDMVDRLLTQRLNQQLLSQAAIRTIENLPTRSQISRLRSVLRIELQKEPKAMQVSVVADFISDLRKTAKGQYENARVETGSNKAPLLSWLRNVCAKVPQDFMQEFLEFSKVKQPNIGGVTSSLLTNGKLKDEHVTEYALRFLDAVLSRAAKESK